MFADIIHVISNLSPSQFYFFLLGLCIGIAATHYVEKYFISKTKEITILSHKAEIAELKSQYQIQIAALQENIKEKEILKTQLENEITLQQIKNEKEIAILQTKLEKALHDTTQIPFYL